MYHKKVNIIIAVFVLLILAGCGKKEAPVQEAEAAFFFKVQFTLGDVKISGTAGEKVANQGDPLNAGDIIITGKKSVADLIFGTSGVVRINENSRVTISTIADKSNNNTEMNMENGKVFLTLSKLRGTGFKVKTPTAVASVRGTSFTVLSDKKGAQLSVVKGTVAVNPVKEGKVFEDKTVSVETGNRTAYIDKKIVEKIIMGKMEIPVMAMTPAEKIEIQAVVKDMKVEAMPELSLELKEEIKQETVSEPVVIEEKKVEEKKAPSTQKEDKAALMKRLAEEKKQKEEELKRQEEELKRQAEEKKVKEEKIKKDRASNIPTM
ncbi:MAG TPA: FecR family protein [Spirochaetota bacterium]|nr:FecR family protein [Spirochaetota bacterium]